MKRRKSQDLTKSDPKRTKKPRVSRQSEGIDKSQQLLRSTPKKTSARKQSQDKRNALGLVCGKPMPPLSELERMYEGSDEDMPAITPAPVPAVSETPGKNEADVSNGSITPNTAKKYADEILKILNGQEAPPQPIIPMKKYKKPEVPYIVGCTERPRIPENPNCNVFKGDDYGITSKTNALNEDEDQDFLNSSGFYINGYSLSKSIFNAQANEIASKLLSNENNPVVGDSDSDDTVVYELNSPKSRFSPEPSTSKDSETILKNDQKFIESFIAPKKSCGEAGTTFEPFSETIEINDDGMANIDIMETRPCTYNKSESNNNNSDKVVILDDTCDTLDVNKTDNKMKSSNMINGEVNTNDYPIVTDVYNPFDPKIIAEIDLTNLNVDEVISENQSLIDKYNKHNNLKTINIVEANVGRPISVENTSALENVTNNEQIKSKNNNINIIQTTNNQHLSNVNYNVNKLDLVVRSFFAKRGNSSFPNNPATGRINLSSREKIFPECSLNDSLDSHKIKKHNSQSKNKNISPINSSCINTEEIPRQPSLGTCPICLEDLTRERVGSTNCGHLFCMSCITTALKTKPKRCPTCRKKLSGLGFHQIFL